jgi:hypothetical protein
MLHNFIVTDIKNSNAKSKNNKLNKSLQNYMYTMLQDSNDVCTQGLFILLLLLLLLLFFECLSFVERIDVFWFPFPFTSFVKRLDRRSQIFGCHDRSLPAQRVARRQNR